jgi:hypothetical protein
LHHSLPSGFEYRLDDLVSQPLVVPLSVIVLAELRLDEKAEIGAPSAVIDSAYENKHDI